MAETLKSRFGPAVVARIGALLAAAWPAFDRRAFVAEALAGFEELELMARADHIATAMQHHLPADFDAAAAILLSSLDHLQPTDTSGDAMAAFLLLPHVLYVGCYGLDHFESAMRLQHALTQRFTAEFSIRRFLEHDPQRTLRQLETWACDPNEHVRRLVSEGSRPRLPWASRLRDFQRDPTPVIALLDKLKDDPSLYVRRSVANNLNDIGKDHPELLIATARRWLSADASPQRRWIIGHALRSAVKRGDPQALALLGYGKPSRLQIDRVAIEPHELAIGDTLTIECELRNPRRQRQSALADLRIHYQKARGDSTVKVFKLKRIELRAGEAIVLRKRLSLADKTTRRHHPGEHRVELLLNGKVLPLGSFLLKRC
ncbi:DNA alkylation repair protein [Piscinibacter sakaiensis]|uniref:DNA alkylation repair protein n=1 Tax=Piscinibacter sakaiensis TaxID=1547922 RepID=UPI003AB0FFE0